MVPTRGISSWLLSLADGRFVKDTSLIRPTHPSKCSEPTSIASKSAQACPLAWSIPEIGASRPDSSRQRLVVYIQAERSYETDRSSNSQRSSAAFSTEAAVQACGAEALV